MKTFIRLVLLCFALFVLLLVVGAVVLTRPGVQKRILEGQLPAGSSIGMVRLTTGSIELSELKLALPDGTQVHLNMLNADFEPLAAYFDKTIKLGALNVEGLVIDTPKAFIETPADPTSPSSSSSTPPSVATPSTGKPTVAEPAVAADRSQALEVESSTGAASPTDALYVLGQLDWLFDIDSVQLTGELRDASGSTFVLALQSGAMRPGEETVIEASLKLNSDQTLQAGLKQFDADARVTLQQNTNGGFEKVRIESLTKASDAEGNKLLTASQELDLVMKGREERASVELLFNVELPKPEIFSPEMVGVGAINVQGSLAASALREEFTLSATNLVVYASGAEVVSLKSNKNFTLGGDADLSGDLMGVRIRDLPLAWLGPWLPAGFELTGEDLTAQFNLTGTPAGALQLSSIAPLRLGPLSLTQDGLPLLQQVTISAQPVIRMAADESISWELNALQIQDRFGEFLSGRSVGRFTPSASSAGRIPSGLQAEAELTFGLQEITQQPALEGFASVMSGRALLDIKIDPAEAYPVAIQGRLEGISPRAYPGQRQDYRFALQISEPIAGDLAVGASLEAGSAKNPSTSLEFAGQVRPEAKPLNFKIDLNAGRLSQRDIDLLVAAFTPQPAIPERTSDARLAEPNPSTLKLPGNTRRPDQAADALPSSAPETTFVPVATESLWADYDGEVDISISEFYLLSGDVVTDLKAQAKVNDALLRISQLKGAYKGGQLSGYGEARFSTAPSAGYTIQSALNVENLDPSVFSKKRSGSFPVRGLFSGEAAFTGQGPTLEAAVDALQGELAITGKEGVLTAFDLDDLMPDLGMGNIAGLGSLGLISADILGKSLSRPGLTAVARAIPYFENMPFSAFSLKLVRGNDRRILIPELLFVGRNILIDGSGSIAATSLKDALSQPLDLQLEIGAKGELIDSLETLELLGPDTTADGFRRWSNTIAITGSLEEPDTSALERLLKAAAKRALTQSGLRLPTRAAGDGKVAVPAEGKETSQSNLSEAREPSKEEKIIQDVGAGLDVINSLFGR